jgi:homoserine dehydrogenase
VARILAESRPEGLELTHVFNRGVSRKRVEWTGGTVQWTEDYEAVLRSDVDVVVELVGGLDPAGAWVRRALESGKSVVTANKKLIAFHGVELERLAAAKGGHLKYGAAVAGGIPVIPGLEQGLAGDRIERLEGILNGTCNYILSRMENDGLPFEVCLADAQRLGYAEADPTFDVGGFDTAHKLAILASLAFGTRIDASAVSVEGISSITLADLSAADELGFRIKLLGVAERTDHGVEQRVHPTMVAKSEPLAQTMGVLNAVTIDGDAVGALTLVGPGAGGDATASAVAADIADLARGIALPTFGRPVDTLLEAERASMQRHEGGYYIRLSVVERPGAMAAIATRMGERKISLEAIMQKRAPKDAPSSPYVPVVLITHATTEASIREALDLTVADGVVRPTPQVIRIERP